MRAVFTSRTATVLTMIGVAVGLGNVWRFPYMMGSYGGSAFLVIYIAFVILFAVPALMGEWALGRATRRGPMGAFIAAFGSRGSWIGGILLFTIFVATSYYLVVVGNVVFTAGFGALHGFSDDTIPTYQTWLARGPVQMMFAWAVLWSAMFVIHKGLHKGIERVSTAFVPFFGIVVVYLIFSSLRLPGAMTHLQTFLKPDFGLLTGTSIFAAMGQAFFSLSLGGTFFLIYGSYLRDEERIPGAAVWTAAGDVGAALLASLFIVPTTLVFGLSLESGPQLIFATLPELFASIPGGRPLGALFLVSLTMVSFLSAVGGLMVLFGAAIDHFKWTPGKAVLIIGLAETILLIPSAMKPSIIGTLDLVFGSGMQVFGSGAALVALAWGLGRITTVRQVFKDERHPQARLFYFWIRWVVPAALAVTLAMYIRDSI